MLDLTHIHCGVPKTVGFMVDVSNILWQLWVNHQTRLGHHPVGLFIGLVQGNILIGNHGFTVRKIINIGVFL